MVAETCTLFLIALTNCRREHLLGVQIATPPSGLLAASARVRVLGKGTFWAVCWLITCSAQSHSLILSSLQPLPLLPAHSPTEPLLPPIPGQEWDARPESCRGSPYRCLSHGTRGECWGPGREPAPASSGWCIGGSYARDWWGQPVLLGVKAATWSPSKVSFACLCYSSNKPKLTLSKACCAGKSL